MVFQGLDQQQAEAIWRPFLDWLAGSPHDFSIVSAPWIVAVPARRFWDPAFLKEVPGVVLTDDRPGAPEANVFWAANLGEAGQVLHGYQSAWLPASLLQPDRQESLGDALFAASRHWRVSLHLNKGLAGAPADAIAAATDTATNPAVLDAFALIISAAEGPPAYPGIPGHEPDLPAARRHAEAIDRAMTETADPAPDRRLLRGGEQFLRGGVAGILLGFELREAARREGQVRSGRPLLRPPRRRQRTLERRRLHEIGRPLSRDDQAGSRRSGLMVTT